MTWPFRQYRKFWHVALIVTFELLLKNFNIAPGNLHNALRGPSWLFQYSSYSVVNLPSCCIWLYKIYMYIYYISGNSYGVVNLPSCCIWLYKIYMYIYYISGNSYGVVNLPSCCIWLYKIYMYIYYISGNSYGVVNLPSCCIWLYKIYMYWGSNRKN